MLCSQVLILVYLILYIVFFGVSVYIPKRAGRNPKGIRGGYPKGKAVLGTLSMVPFFSLIILYIYDEKTVDWFLRIPMLDTDIFMVSGLLLMGIGLFIEIVGIVTLGENFRIMIPNDKTDLITTGIYTYVRHPIGLSVMMIVIGIFLVIPNVLALVNLVWNILFYNDKATYEETYLKRAHQEYSDYMKRVGKFLPKIRRKR